MGDDTYTHKDLAKLIAVSETTIKSYRRKFPEFFPMRSSGKPIRFKSQAARACELIRSCFSRDFSVAETRARLAKEFPASPPPKTPARPAPPEASLDPAALAEFGRKLDHLAELGTETNQRLKQLQETMADFLTLRLSREDAISKVLSDLSLRLEKLAGSIPDPAKPGPAEPARTAKLVRLKNVYGQTSEYLVQSKTQARKSKGLAPEPSEAGPSGPAEPLQGREPPADMPPEIMDLPLVVKSTENEYLGIAGKADRAFSLNSFIGLLEKAFPRPRHFSLGRSQFGEGWRVEAEQPEVLRPLRYVLDLVETKTPRGNAVVLLTRFEMNGKETPPANLYAVIRKMIEMTA